MTYKTFSLGCKVNSYETNAVSTLLQKEGYVEDDNNPDVIIINTCSVTQTADQKSRQHIRKFKKLYPKAIIVVMGCYSQKNHQFIKDEISPHIIIGTSNRSLIPSLIKKYLVDKKKIDLVEDNPRLFEYEEISTHTLFNNVRAYLKIQDGCNNFCSYCLIPYLRGKMRSRDPSKVLLEAEELVNKGYKEIVLTGIHVGGYGQDRNDIHFSDLVESLLNIKGLERLRISSIEESEIDEKLIYLLKTRDNLAKHLHIPLQSGSDLILKLMNRKYNKEQFLNKIKYIKKECPTLAVTTDVITGFPYESEEEFNNTYNFIKECGFHMLHVFPFSPRSGTKAMKMDHQIDPVVKKERATKLIDLSNQLWDEYLESYNNKPISVLVEEYDEESDQYIGHSSNYIKVSFKSKTARIGEFSNVIYKKD